MNEASRVGIGSSIGLIASFLLPWVQILGLGASGYNLSQLGSYGNFAWLVPAVGIVCLLANTSKQAFGRARKSVSMIGALVIAGGTIFIITQIAERAGEGFWHAIGIGIYVLLISSITLFISGWMTSLESGDKAVFGVIAGYGVMSLFFFAVFTGAYLALGPERVFQPDSYEVSTLWLVIYGAVYFCGGILACLVSTAISRTERTCQVLAFVVFIVGLLLCIPAMRDSGGLNIRAGEVTSREAMQLAKLPRWMHSLGPAIGAAGVLLVSMRKFGSAA